MFAKNTKMFSAIAMAVTLVTSINGQDVKALEPEPTQHQVEKNGTKPGQYEFNKWLQDYEYNRRHAAQSQFYSLQTENYENCNLSCPDYPHLQDSCPMDCRFFYATQEISLLTTKIVHVTTVYDELKHNFDDISKQQRETAALLQERMDRMEDQITCLWIILGLLLFAAVISVVFVLIKGKPWLDKKIQKQKLHGHPDDEELLG